MFLRLRSTGAYMVQREAPSDVVIASFGVVCSVLLAYLVTVEGNNGGFATETAIGLSYLAVWVPLLGAVLIAISFRGKRSLRLDFGARFTWLDVLFGLTLGFFLRSIATLIEIFVYGRPAAGSITLGPTVYDMWWILLAIAAPVLIAPVVEELFFRGLLQRAVQKASGRSFPASSHAPAVVAVAVSSLVFAAVHILQTNGSTQMVVVGTSTLILGIGLGTLVAVTGRLGGAIIAHMVFNGLGVLATLL